MSHTPHRSRRSRLAPVLAAALAAASLLAPAAASATPAPAPASARPAAAAANPLVDYSGPRLFGAYTGLRDGVGFRTATAQFEKVIGRKLDLRRNYPLWDDAEPSSVVTDDVKAGRTPFISIEPRLRRGGYLAWSDIADGRYDADIVRQAKGLKSVGTPLILAFHHEPEDETFAGQRDPAAFRAAYRHYVQVFRSVGATNVAFAVVFMPYTYSGDIDAWYPGDDVVDWIANDPYDFNACKPGRSGYRSLETVIAPFVRWSANHHKPLALAEWASWSTSDAVQQRWLEDAETTLSGLPQIKAISFFNENGSCPWWVDQWPGYQAELRAFAQGHPAYAPTVGQLTATTTRGEAPLVTTFAGSARTLDGSTLGVTPDHWSVDFGDGTGASGSGAPSGVTHSYAAGTWTATLTLVDTNGKSATATRTLTALATAPAPAAPTVVETGPAYPDTTTRFRFAVDPGASATTYSLAYGTDPDALTTATPDAVLPAGVGLRQLVLPVSGLTPDTTYYWRVSASNAAGTAVGELRSFRVVAAPWVSSVGARPERTTAALTGWVDPHGLHTTYRVVYGTDPVALRGSTGERVLRPSEGRVTLTSTATGLRPGTRYYWQVVAVNRKGAAHGALRSFVTGD